MKRSELFGQYDRFLAQLRTEVDQTFWLYNFFFIIDSALLGVMFWNGDDLGRYKLMLVIAAGFVLSAFWNEVIGRKDEWRKDWLARIAKVEKEIGIPEDLSMWPTDRGPRRGLWRTLFYLPKSFFVLWCISFVYYFYMNIL